MTVESTKARATHPGRRSPWVHISPQWSNRILRIAIVLGALAVAAGIGMLGGRLAQSKYFLVAFGPALIPLAIIGIEFILRRRDLGPLLILICAAFIPLKISTGTNSPIVGSLLVAMALVGAWVLRMVVIDKRLSLHPSPVNKPLLGFITVVIIALIWANLLVDSSVIWRSFSPVQVGSAVVMVMLPASFLLVANQTKILTLKAMAWTMLAAGAVGLIGQYGGIRLPVNTGGMFNLWIMALAIGFALFYSKLSNVIRALLVALAGAYMVWGFGLHITWVAGWLPGLVAIGVLIFMRSKPVAMVAIVALVLLVVVFNADYFGTVFGNERLESGQSRLAAWEVNWRVTKDHLLFGTGPGGYASYYMSYFPNEAMATHSNYIDILAQTGIVGFVTYVLFFAVVTICGFRFCKRVKGRGDFVEGLANASFAGTIACIVIMGFGDWLIPFAYTQTIAGFDYAVYNWLFMGAIVALDRIVKNEATQGTAHA